MSGKVRKMNSKIAKVLLALVASLGIAGAALAAPLNTFPDFLATKTDGVSSLNALVVVGEKAHPSDIVAAIDLAATLASLSYREVSTGVTVSGVEGKVFDDYGLGDTLSKTLSQTQVPFLQRGTIEYDNEQYTVAEYITLTGMAIENNWVPLNGTPYLDVSTDGTIRYTFDFKTSPNISTLTYDEPLTITLLGQEFSIRSASDGSLTVIAGTTGIADGTTPVKYGNHYIYVIDGNSGTPGWAKIAIKDAAGNVEDVEIVDEGSSVTVTIGGDTFTIKLLRVWPSTITSTVSGKLVVGSEIDKVYREGDFFPGTDLWKFTDITVSGDELDKIVIDYITPNETYDRIAMGEKVVAPNDYFEVGFTGLAVSQYATLTISKTSSVNIYEDVTSTSAMISGKPALVLEADFPIFGDEEYKKAYIVAADGMNNVTLAYYDESASKAIYQSSVNVTDGDTLNITNVKYDLTQFYIEYDTNGLRIALPEKVTAYYRYDSGAGKFILGSTENSAESTDVNVTEDGTTYTVGTAEYTITLESGTQVLNIKSNADSEKVVLKITPEPQKALVYVGRAGATTTTETGATKEVVPITTSIAKLDSEVTSAEKSAYNIVLVGGPCANDLVQELVDAGKLGEEYTCAGGTPGSAWTTDTAYIFAIDDAFTTGKVALVAAGTMAKDTRAAVSVLQNYATQLSGITASSVKIDTSVAAPYAVTALE